MPTGYTCIIDEHENTTFGQYVWRCARAFGALVLMRDEDLGAEIPQSFEPSDHHAKGLKEAKIKLAQLERTDHDMAEVAAAASYRAALKSWEEWRDREAEIDRRYSAIREQVIAWAPPTPDHVHMKEFMLQQLTESRKFSGPGEKPKQMSGSEWLAAEIKSAQWHVDYHREHHEKELARTAERNAWLKALRESVPYESQPE